ncbi:hypothetical protein E2C01_088357 [Portunus trituberculatus]|uniref:Uncharacterized protein n=1 Tax=Portunus trituberculatus TaxID=210409 RepID=A0A5B7JLP5_PORTR|nr:hypothetical protein [Portunus trituberculatus]
MRLKSAKVLEGEEVKVKDVLHWLPYYGGGGGDGWRWGAVIEQEEEVGEKALSWLGGRWAERVIHQFALTCNRREIHL